MDEIELYTRNKRHLHNVDVKTLLETDFTMDLYNILFAPRDIESKRKKVSLFHGLKVEEMYLLNNPDCFIDLFKKEIDNIYVISYKNELILFEDGLCIKPEKIKDIDEKYAVRKITDNVYIGYFRNGLIRIEI